MENTNFDFLKDHEVLFFQLATTAEKAFASDPNTTLFKLRQLGEALAQDVASRIGLEFPEKSNQSDLLYQINRKIGLDPIVRELFHTLRLSGNKAAHQFQTTHKEAIDALKVARQLAIWHCQAFSSKCVGLKPGPFTIPDDPSEKLTEVQEEIQLLKAKLQETNQQFEGNQELLHLHKTEAAEYEGLAQKMQDERNVFEQLALDAEAELVRVKKDFDEKLKQTRESKNDESIQSEIRKIAQKVRKASSKLRLSEEETRIIIDAQLRERGWQVDSNTIDYNKGARPEQHTNKAIAEWPCYNQETKKHTRADYVLFVGLIPVAAVEAKKFGNDVMDDLRQAEEYSRDLSKVTREPGNFTDLTTAESSPPYNSSDHNFKTAFAFSTNGREFQHQLKTKSGIWFRDLRKSTNKSRPLMAWPTPDELLESLENKFTQPELLESESMDYLGLRPFQEKAVKAVEQAITHGQRQILIAMATGTGKTRTTIGLMYRLLKARMFNRILFLVDRNTLGIQAQDAFKDMRLERNKSFSEIYDVKELKDQAPDTKTKVQVATVQAMVRRVFESDNPIPIRQYDCIVVDEAHRGYTLDKDMTEGEMELRNFNDYVSAYRRVLDYFDAVRIGLTATPAAHTVDIFGHPVFTYSYREAVIDGWLVDYEPPYTLQTRLNKEGIHFDSGATVTIVNNLGETRIEELPDELDFDVDDFNQRVLNENFNKVVCDELAKNYLDPTSREKTLVFCINDQHADMVVKLMEDALDTYHGPQDANTVMKITGSIRDPQGAIRQFKNEQIPNIAVTVDLLTTGVDIVRLCNLVFLRRVRSRILYEQMKGRATRLCDDINKDLFRIFDCVRLYEVLEAVDTMRPVVQRISVSMEQLIEELLHPEADGLSGEITSDKPSKITHAEDVHQQIIARLQRISRRAKNTDKFPEAQEPLQLLNTLLEQAGQPKFIELAAKFKEVGPKETAQFFSNNPQFLKLLSLLSETLKFSAGEMVISEHHDEVLEVGRGYGADEEGKPIAKPEDYLESFTVFVKENINKVAALKVVVTRPRDLTREDLRELRLFLAENEFDERRLRVAWKAAKNEDIAASIIGYIRQAAIGSALMPFDERVDKALLKIKSGRSWSQNQERWLNRLAAQLKKEIVIDNTLFSSPAFKQQGGRKVLEAQFPGEVDKLLDQFSHYMWEMTA